MRSVRERTKPHRRIVIASVALPRLVSGERRLPACMPSARTSGSLPETLLEACRLAACAPRRDAAWDDRTGRLARLTKRLLARLSLQKGARRKARDQNFNSELQIWNQFTSSAPAEPILSETSKKKAKPCATSLSKRARKRIDDAKIDPAEIQAAAVGNFNAGQFTKQLHLGAFIPEIDRETPWHSDDAHRSGLRFRRAFRPARRAMDHGRISRRRSRRRRGATKDHVVTRRLRRSGRGGGFRRRAAGIWRFHVSEIVRAHRADLHR